MLRVHPRIAWQVVAGEAILLDLDNGRAIGLNETGTFLWPLLGTQDEGDLLESLVREFDVDRDMARRDLERFVALLRENGFIQDTA
ncbi:MAG TPA: PqqD family protein [Thermoanaerobaculia bacterium]|nr:PqqD family protein [Thermoanaerobaculia bacterium]HQN06340.1 PqqD family protein [Thermoanaerobaculia bacterium]HQP88922.1 PqqD family protein [Thermoanaerobaculia bacterium]